MRAIRRSGLLALTLVSATVLADEQQTDVGALPVTHQNWITDQTSEALPDGSVLTEYFGEATIENPELATLRVGFIPRFGCSPLISMHLAVDTEATYFQLRSPVGYSDVAVTIDGSPIRFTVIVDDNQDQLSVYLTGNMQKRVSARIRIDQGDKLYTESDSGELLAFSLLGSTNSLQLAEKRCQGHVSEPVSQAAND